MKSNREILRSAKTIPAALLIALGASSCSSAIESNHGEYECGDLKTWTVQDNNTFDGLIQASGALEEARQYDDDQQLTEALTQYASTHDMKFPEASFTISTQGEHGAENPIIHEGQKLRLPTECKRLED